MIRAWKAFLPGLNGNWWPKVALCGQPQPIGCCQGTYVSLEGKNQHRVTVLPLVSSKMRFDCHRCKARNMRPARSSRERVRFAASRWDDVLLRWAQWELPATCFGACQSEWWDVKRLVCVKRQPELLGTRALRAYRKYCRSINTSLQRFRASSTYRTFVCLNSIKGGNLNQSLVEREKALLKPRPPQARWRTTELWLQLNENGRALRGAGRKLDSAERDGQELACLRVFRSAKTVLNILHGNGVMALEKWTRQKQKRAQRPNPNKGEPCRRVQLLAKAKRSFSAETSCCFSVSFSSFEPSDLQIAFLFLVDAIVGVGSSGRGIFITRTDPTGVFQSVLFQVVYAAFPGENPVTLFSLAPAYALTQTLTCYCAWKTSKSFSHTRAWKQTWQCKEWSNDVDLTRDLPATPAFIVFTVTLLHLPIHISVTILAMNGGIIFRLTILSFKTQLAVKTFFFSAGGGANPTTSVREVNVVLVFVARRSVFLPCGKTEKQERQINSKHFIS